MKKTLLLLTSISVVLGAGYATWAYTPLGKKILSKWLVKRWGEMAKQEKKKLDLKILEKELIKLNYKDHELLFFYTRNDFLRKEKSYLGHEKRHPLAEKEVRLFRQKFRNYVEKLKKRKIFKKADLSSLENIVFPG